MLGGVADDCHHNDADEDCRHPELVGSDSTEATSISLIHAIMAVATARTAIDFPMGQEECFPAPTSAAAAEVPENICLCVCSENSRLNAYVIEKHDRDVERQVEFLDCASRSR